MLEWTIDGRCPCGGQYEDRRVEVRIASTVTGEPAVLESVAQGSCPRCGSRVYTNAVLQRIEAVFSEAQQRPAPDTS
ncbi:hypothetical protein EV649_5094 [Kribbella sp. VKM Ac-2569]|nr:hypothetical protein EV649_5094 [Kribbella sp. VKM Ac-2569]